MRGPRRIAAVAATLAALAVTMPGCMFAVGSTLKGSSDRVTRLEERMAKAEKKLGIADPAGQAQ